MSNVNVPKWTIAGLVGVVALTAAPESEAKQCRWFGTDPICEGACPRGWQPKGRPQFCTISGMKVYCCERQGSTTSDGGGSPYRPPKNRPPPTSPKPQGPVVSSNNRNICAGDYCGLYEGTSRYQGCMQDCMNRLANRGRR